MLVGVIDLGTNSVRFDVFNLAESSPDPIYRDKRMIRLGENLFSTNRLDPDAIARLFKAMDEYKTLCTKYRVERVLAFATSAMRSADDGPDILAAIKKRTGISIRIISGEEEARLIAEGILPNITPPKEYFGLVDIGGGSTEISICLDRQVLHSASLPLGVARLQQVFLRTSPPLHTKPLRYHIQSVVETYTGGWNPTKVSRFIGSSGTIRTIARIFKLEYDDKTITPKKMEKLRKAMRSMNSEELLTVKGVTPKRVDLILAGVLLLEELMKMFEVRTVMPTHYALRDGILGALINETHGGKRHRRGNTLFQI